MNAFFYESTALTQPHMPILFLSMKPISMNFLKLNKHKFTGNTITKIFQNKMTTFVDASFMKIS